MPVIIANNQNNSSDDTDSLFSALNSETVNGNATNELTSEKYKANNNNDQSWTDSGKQNSEEEIENNPGKENENDTGIFIFFKVLCIVTKLNLYLQIIQVELLEK